MNDKFSSYSTFISELNTLKSLDKDENLNLIEEYQKTKDLSLRNEIIEGNMRLVLSIAIKNANKSRLPVMDLIQEGSLGLISAVENFDSSLKIPFSSYAGTKIQNAIYDYMTTYGNVISIPRYIFRKVTQIETKRNQLTLSLSRKPSDEEIANALGDGYDAQKVRDTLVLFKKTISMDECFENDEDFTFSLMDNLSTENDPSDLYRQKEIVRFYKEALEELDARSKDILLSRALAEGKKTTLEELSQKYHVSKERVRQIEEESINSVRDYVLKRL